MVDEIFRNWFYPLKTVNLLKPKYCQSVTASKIKIHRRALLNVQKLALVKLRRTGLDYVLLL